MQQPSDARLTQYDVSLPSHAVQVTGFLLEQRMPSCMAACLWSSWTGWTQCLAPLWTGTPSLCVSLRCVLLSAHMTANMAAAIPASTVMQNSHVQLLQQHMLFVPPLGQTPCNAVRRDLSGL